MSASGYSRFLELNRTDLELLRKRASELGRAPTDVEAGDLVDLVELTSRGQVYAVPLAAVEGITELTSLAAVPRAPDFVCGMASFRGEVLIGVEISRLIGAAQGFTDLKRVIALSHDGKKLAIVAEKSLQVRSTPLMRFKTSGVGQHPLIVGTDESFVSLIDVSALVRHTFDALGRQR